MRTRAFIFNTLIYEKSVDDRLRSFPHWLSSRNLSNEASDESVSALIEAVRGRFELTRRWYRLKARLLGIERLADYDRSAPVQTTETTFAYADARDLVLETYDAFSPCRERSRGASSRRTGSMPPSARTSAAARSARTRCRACTRM